MDDIILTPEEAEQIREALDLTVNSTAMDEDPDEVFRIFALQEAALELIVSRIRAGASTSPTFGPES